MGCPLVWSARNGQRRPPTSAHDDIETFRHLEQLGDAPLGFHRQPAIAQDRNRGQGHGRS